MDNTARSRPSTPMTAATIDLEKPESSMTLPKTAPSIKTGKYWWDQRGIGQQHCAKCSDRGEQDHTVAAIGHKHQKDKSAQHDQEIHSDTPFPMAIQWIQARSSC